MKCDKCGCMCECERSCSRCGKKIPQHWSEEWPVFCNIRIGRHSRILDAICKGTDWDVAYQHPAYDSDNCQELRLSWSNMSKWPICSKCQDEFLRMIGSFLGLLKEPTHD